MGQLAVMKPKTAIEKRTHTTVDTLMLTPELILKWKLPIGQRPLRENAKVKALAERLKTDRGVLPGIITLGVLSGSHYIIDGQHRIHAFLLSGLKEGFADVRLVHAEAIKDIHSEFVELNSKLVQMRPDDFLRGLEDSITALQRIRKECPFVGYDMIRRNNTSSPIVSMSAVIRVWRGSAAETPAHSGLSAVELAEGMVEEETRSLLEYLKTAHDGFGRDPEFRSLWTALNLCLTMWLFRRLVLFQYSPKTPRLDRVLFKKCLMSLSADSGYLDWLVGRKLCERDRSPAYARIRSLFTKRLEAELGKRISMPAPAWSLS